MAGENIAYQLRINKSVDRNLFVDTLIRISGYYSDIKNYTYYGFAGPYFEDFKLLHLRLNINNMVSWESNKQVYDRQVFNKPYNCIQILNKKSSDCLSDISSDTDTLSSPCIVWLDYAEANERSEQIVEFVSLIDCMKHGDIARITLNANPNALFQKKDNVSGDDINKLRKDAYEKNMPEKQIPECDPSNFSKKESLARIIYYAIYKAAISDRFDKKTVFYPITISNYADGPHPMLTCTGIVLDKGKEIDFLEKTKITSWDMLASDYTDWERVKINCINVPALTMKEKLAIDASLPVKGGNDIATLASTIKERGKLQIKEKEIADYIKYYRYYPNYRQIML